MTSIYSNISNKQLNIEIKYIYTVLEENRDIISDQLSDMIFAFLILIFCVNLMCGWYQSTILGD